MELTINFWLLVMLYHKFLSLTNYTVGKEGEGNQPPREKGSASVHQPTKLKNEENKRVCKNKQKYKHLIVNNFFKIWMLNLHWSPSRWTQNTNQCKNVLPNQKMKKLRNITQVTSVLILLHLIYRRSLIYRKTEFSPVQPK